MLLLVRGYYAAGKTLVPFIVSTIVAASTVLFGAAGLLILHDQAVLHIMEHALRVDALHGSNVLVLALAYSLAAIIGTLLLLADFERQFKGLVRRIRWAFLESCIASLAGGLSAYIVLSLASRVTLSFTTPSIFIQGFVAGMCGIVVTAGTYYLLGSREFLDVYASLRGRIWRGQFREEVTVTTSAEDQTGPASA
jgi:peptidoglycan biosynthesis protein MviN/MurJ (putative lipid II flippase)